MALIKTSPLYKILMAAPFLLMLSGCVKDHVTTTSNATYTYTKTTLVYKTKAEFLASLNGNIAEPVKSAGKLFVKGDFIYLNEINKGIHIINNSNPAKPAQVAFLNIPGNLDIAVKNNTLYADTYTDLLAIDISNPAKASISKTIANFFEARAYAYNLDSNLVIADIITKDTTVSGYAIFPGCATCMYTLANNSVAGASTQAAGTAGSMASMVLVNDYLYALREPHSMGIVDVQQSAQPNLDTTFSAGFDLQTVFPFEGKLFLGSMSGMFMYDISNPTNPVQLGTFKHGTSCDPVVTDGAFAYVTLHAGTSCGGAANELDVIDIKNLNDPALVNTYPLTKPTGLCKDGNLLFVCDDDSGVRVYDATVASSLKQINKIDIKGSYDIIAGSGHAMVVTQAGLYQYDYSNPAGIRQLSFYSLKN